jgi:malate dehydrogenase
LSGGVGQSLALLLKCHSLVQELAIYDIINSPGIAVDLSHINTRAVVTGYLPTNSGLASALQNADIVFVIAGVAQKVLSLKALLIYSYG